MFYQWLACFLVLNVQEEDGSIKAEGGPLFVCIQATMKLIIALFLHSNSGSKIQTRKLCLGLTWVLFGEKKQRSILTQSYQDDKLGGVAREAKERLDERLRSQRKSEPKRHSNKEGMKCVDGKSLVQGELRTEVFGSKKSASKRFSWAKLNWKASDQDECAICLERFKVDESLVHPPCAHRFHSRCLVPWLENHAHCPCCRMGILS
ncbi:hypothetical protein CXB51_019200 [Gossypium anomalum]|uniref:RING-type domain-containing protein n=1 Tax=Gossypium anomalum TaxID=47600 RepID=A0A8J5YKK5_9ROSI|nr:hypothetical protein CXB51_019200 [Gossypium anomalum]